MNQTRTAKRFDPARLGGVANEPNLASLGWARPQGHNAAPGRRRSLAFVSLSAGCLALMFGLMWAGDATPAVYAIVGLGAAVMTAVCVITES